MDTVKIKLNPFKDLNGFFLNQRPVSQYSEMNNFIREPLLNWADKVFDAIEREINDDYRLVIEGDGFEKEFIADLKNNYPGCVEFETQDHQLSHSIDKRLGNVLGVAEKYYISMAGSLAKLPVCDESGGILDDRYMVPAPSGEAFLTAAYGTPDLCSRIYEYTSPLLLVITNRNRITCLGNGRYIWEIEKQRKETVVGDIIDYFVKIKMMQEAGKRLEFFCEKIEQQDRDTLHFAKETERVLKVRDIPELEISDEYIPQVFYVPDDIPFSQYRMESLNDDIIMISDGKLAAVDEGKTSVRFYDAESGSLFAEKEVIVSIVPIEVYYLEEMEAGSTYTLVFEPIRENISIPGCRVVSTNEDVIQAEGDNLKAVGAGKAKVEIYMEDRNLPFASVWISVYPANSYFKSITLKYVDPMKYGDVQLLTVEADPPEAEETDPLYWYVESDDKYGSSFLDEMDENGNRYDNLHRRLFARDIGTLTVHVKSKLIAVDAEITVPGFIEKITLSETEMELKKNQGQQIQAYYYPSEVSDSECYWRTSDSKVAVIGSLEDGTDVILATGVGECDITCYASRGAAHASADCHVMVRSKWL